MKEAVCHLAVLILVVKKLKNGIKGFIFGERGVWRPGDSLYINCIIEDKDSKLPADHPVEFELFTPQGQLYQRMVQTNANEGFNVFKTATAAKLSNRKLAGKSKSWWRCF